MSERVAIIDDDGEFAEFVREACETFGFDARVFLTAKEARQEMAEFAPHVVVLDIVMPNEDGIEFLQALAGNDHRPRILLVTGYDARYAHVAEEISRALGIEIVATLTKPVRLAELRAALQPGA